MAHLLWEHTHAGYVKQDQAWISLQLPSETACFVELCGTRETFKTPFHTAPWLLGLSFSVRPAATFAGVTGRAATGHTCSGHPASWIQVLGRDPRCHPLPTPAHLIAARSQAARLDLDLDLVLARMGVVTAALPVIARRLAAPPPPPATRATAFSQDPLLAGDQPLSAPLPAGHAHGEGMSQCGLKLHHRRGSAIYISRLLYPWGAPSGHEPGDGAQVAGLRGSVAKAFNTGRSKYVRMRACV